MRDWELFKSTLRDFLRVPQLVAIAALAALPAVIALVWRAAAGRGFGAELAYNTLCAGLVFGFTLVILSVVFGTAVISQEIERKTIVYLTTHAVPRWRLILAKFAAALVVTVAAVWLASLFLAAATFGPGHLFHSRLGRDLAILPIGALAYSALFLLMATFVPRPLIWGLLFAFGWESWVPSLPGDFHRLSLMAYLRVLAPHPQPQSDTVDLSSFISALNPTEISPRLSWTVLLAVIVVCLAAAVAVFSLREYAPRDDAE